MNQHDFKHYHYPRSSRQAFGCESKFSKSRLDRISFSGHEPESSPLFVIICWAGAVVLFLAMGGWLNG